MIKALLLVSTLSLAPLTAYAARPAATAPTAADLITRIECTTWRRDTLELRMERAQRENPGAWTLSMQIFYEGMLHLDAFENTHIRLWIDADSQDMVVDSYWPDGIDAADATAIKCAIYRDPQFLRAPVIIGALDLPQKEDLFTQE